MPRTNKRIRSSSQIIEIYNEIRHDAINAIAEIVSDSLDKHGVSETAKLDFFKELSNVLEITVDPSEVSIKKETKSTDDVKNFVTSSSQRRLTGKDMHNEVCEVCEIGGDLLCCDTCSLVFHLHCLRPKISVVPKGNWSCPFCVLDGTAVGNVKDAAKSVRIMKQLANSLKSSDISITRSDKKIVVRRTIKGQIVELGRFDNIEDALNYLLKTNPALFPRSIDSDNESNSVSSGESENELWCTFCLDDPSIKLCAFCGCRECFGKHLESFLILCDSCDQETHTFCLKPPLQEIPKGTWYCVACQGNISDVSTWQLSDSEPTNIEVVTRTGQRGRPKGGINRGRPKGRPLGWRPAAKTQVPSIGDRGSSKRAKRMSEAVDDGHVARISDGEIINNAESSDHINPNIETIKAIISNMGQRQLTAEEKLTLRNFRESKSLVDLKEALALLIEQKNILLSQSMNENVINNQG